MTDIIASPAVKEAVKIVMEQQERLGKNAAEAVSAADLPGASQPIRASVLRAAKRKIMPAIASMSKAS